MLSVNHLAMLAKTACSLSGVLDWVDQSLADVEEHLKVYAFGLDHLRYCWSASETIHTIFIVHAFCHPVILVFLKTCPYHLSVFQFIIVIILPTPDLSTTHYT